MEPKNLIIPFSHIGDEYILNFGVRSQYKREHNFLFQDIEAKWLRPSLEEYDLLDVKNYDGRIKLSKAGELVRAHGYLKMHPMLECVKCLTRFRSEIEAKIEAYFSPGLTRNDKKTKEEIELKAAELTEYEYKDNQISLDELLVDVIETSIPESPYCRSDCLGLCPECGVDQNLHGMCAQHNKIQ